MDTVIAGKRLGDCRKQDLLDLGGGEEASCSGFIARRVANAMRSTNLTVEEELTEAQLRRL